MAAAEELLFSACEDANAYTPNSQRLLTIFGYPESNAVGFKVCNNTAASITSGAILNWRVLR
jgi:hypothetical protein